MGSVPQRPATPDKLSRIAEFNRTETQFPDGVTLTELFEAQVDRHPSRTAAICDHDQTFGTPVLSYAQFNARVNQLAHRLRAECVRPGHLVALMVERSFAMAIGV